MTLMTRPRHADSHKLMPGEVPLDIAETFFSRTDERGIIRAGNGVFRRVSGYDWDGLLNAPHKLVRHADMPKGVFHMMWRDIQKGRVVAAYVKNKSRDGRFYWVLSVISPVEGGYMSVRIKPTSAIHQRVITLYEDLLAAEAEGMTPEQSAAHLLTLLEQDGFANYEVFQSLALMTEVVERAKRTERAVESWQSRFRLMSDSIIQIQQETEEMLAAFRSIRTVPMNMRILASRLENAGGPISAISVNYGAMLDEMTTWVQNFSRGENSPFARIRDSILSGQFLAFVALVQMEMSQRFGKQTTSAMGEIDIPGEKAKLVMQAAEYRKRATSALKVVEMEADHLARSVLDMKRYVTGLSSTRMMCKIESAMLDDSGEALAGIVDQLDYCQNTIETRLSRISELNGLIQSNTAMLRATA
ncbi:MAG: PAS domain S-box protein [Primorskyibacter sp.]